tara:strand:+ start:8719 stop:10086 length:1368 start_codon:yes stop_codon:yes gene_type:complete
MKINNKILLLLISVIILSCSSGENSVENPTDDNIEKINYFVSPKVISNPERGFMHSWSVASEGEPLNLVTLQSLKNQNVTLILRLYNLASFKNSDLSNAQLDLIKTDFERLRTAGIKCVLRFAYNENQNETDAPLTSIERHLDQLKPVFAENADVIAFVQAGFIGSWGEWYFTTNNLTTLENKKAVVNKLLEVLPKEVKIQLRTPLYKQEVFDYTSAMNASVGYGDSDIARVGFHNDCFLASVDDYGTYNDVVIEKNYINREALFVPTGGETCPPSGIPTASCSTADTEMSLLRWTYLNLDYYGPVLNVWRNNGCFEDFQKELGYRLVLKSAELQKEVAVNSSFELNAVIDNIGFAPIYSVKNSFLVFKSTTDGTLYKKALNFDIRKVIPEVNYELQETVNISDIPPGSYELHLKIEDRSAKLADRVEYAIQLANSGTWDGENALNSLSHTLIIN